MCSVSDLVVRVKNHDIFLRCAGLAVVLAELPLGPPDGDTELLPSSSFRYRLSCKRRNEDLALASHSQISFDTHEIEITCAQLVWLLSLVDTFSTVRCTSKDAEAHDTQTPAPFAEKSARDASNGVAKSAPRTCNLASITGNDLHHATPLCDSACSRATDATFDVSLNGLRFSLKTFSKTPILRVSVDDFHVMVSLARDQVEFGGSCMVEAQAMSDFKHVWEQILEPCSIACTLACHREAVLCRDLNVVSANFVEIRCNSVCVALPQTTYAL